MWCHLVSTRINHVTNEYEECSRPVELVHLFDLSKPVMNGLDAARGCRGSDLKSRGNVYR